MLWNRMKAAAIALAAPGLLLAGCGNLMTAALHAAPTGRLSASSIEADRIEAALAPYAVHDASDTNSVQLHVDGAEGFTALEQLIRSAQKSIYAEYFIWHNDKTGNHICDLLIEQKKKGREVKVIIDTIGGMPKGDSGIVKRFEQAGIEIHRYPMLSIAGIFNGTRSGITLTHRKLMIVDGWHCMTGGMNIGDEYSTPGAYHDLMLRVEGRAAHDLMNEYERDWKRVGGTPLQSKDPIGYDPTFGTENVRIAVTSPTEKDRASEWFQELIAAIDAAQSEICLESPYFSDDDLMEHLSKARQRGIGVRVIMAVANNDDKLYKRLNIDSARQLMSEGVEFRTYPGGRFSHTKYTCIDGCWTVIGTANCDARSFHENQEIVTQVSGTRFASEAQSRVFEKDWAISKPMGTLKSNSLKKGLWDSALEILDYYL